MPALHHLYTATRRGALVLLIVCSFSLLALASGNSAPVATDVRATTSGAQTLITISGTAPMAYSIKRPDARTVVIELPGVDASRLSPTYAVTSPLVEKVTVEREANGSQQLNPSLRVELRAPARDRSQMADNNLVLELRSLCRRRRPRVRPAGCPHRTRLRRTHRDNSTAHPASSASRSTSTSSTQTYATS